MITQGYEVPLKTMRLFHYDSAEKKKHIFQIQYDCFCFRFYLDLPLVMQD